MATRAKRSYGTYLQKGNGASPEVFATIAEVKDISGPSGRRLSEDVTNMDSPGAWAEHVPTTLEAGDVTFQLNLLQDEATHTQLRAALEAGTVINWRILFPPQPATKRCVFAAFVQEIGQEFPVKGAMMQPLSIKITGPVTVEPNV